MVKLGVFLAVAISLLLVACAGTGATPTPIVIEKEVIREVEVIVEKEVIREVMVEGADARQERAFPGATGDFASSASQLETVQRQVISTAFISIEVEVVQAAVTQVRGIAEGLGGFVEQLSSSGSADRQQATMTIRVPQEQFFTAMDRIQALGEVQSQNLGSEDVSERFIDLEARLQSALRQEKSLLSLLDKADRVSDILTIERELSRVRSDIERFQGQLNFLERRVDLATITVSLFQPGEKIVEPPSASLTVEVSDVTGSVSKVKALVSTRDGVVDNVFLSVQDGKESAIMSLRVFTKDFDQSVGSIEKEGNLQSKELREGTEPKNGAAKPNKEPDARIGVSFVEKEQKLPVVLIIGIGLVALLGLLFYLTYRAGRRRRSSV